MKRANVAIAVITLTIGMVAFAKAVSGPAGRPETAPGGGDASTNESQLDHRQMITFPPASAPIDVFNPNARVLKILPVVTFR
jgi:hypothetical protein